MKPLRCNYAAHQKHYKKVTKMNKKTIATALRALAKTVETLENAPVYVVPAFDASVESPIEYATRITKESKAHGDSEQANKNAMYKALEDGFRNIVTENDLSKVRAPRQTGTVKTASEFTKEDCANVYKQRVSGVQMSTVCEAMGTSYQNLSMAMKKHLGDDVFDRIKAERNAAALVQQVA